MQLWPTSVLKQSRIKDYLGNRDLLDPIPTSNSWCGVFIDCHLRPGLSDVGGLEGRKCCGIALYPNMSCYHLLRICTSGSDKVVP